VVLAAVAATLAQLVERVLLGKDMRVVQVIQTTAMAVVVGLVP
jgi:hypothetical protein